MTMLKLLAAIIMVESGGDPQAYNASEKAAGILQIRPIMVEEVNRILELRGSTLRFTLADRWCPDESVLMFNVYANHLARVNGPMTTEEVARCWNGGPKGASKKSTEKYWIKVKQRLQ